MIHEVIRHCLKIKIKRLPRKFISNINISFNKEYLNETVIVLYQKFKLLPALEVLQKNYLIKEETVYRK